MFSIRNLSVSVENKPILHEISLQIRPGEIHVVMGPNGSGKSTLANTIMGHPKYTVTSGEIFLDAENLTNLKPDKRSQAGVFLAFQYSKEIPGVTVFTFLRTAVSAIKKARNEPCLNPFKFRKLLREKLFELGMDAKFMNRYMNEGFSGGEKKKMEILQMAMLEPKIAILDETDSGLDIDALKIAADKINKLVAKKCGILIITHYQRILRYVKPDFVHVMMHGKLIKSGTDRLAKRLEREGYVWLREKKLKANAAKN